MSEEFKTVAKFTDSISAQMAADWLEAHGIKAGVFGEASSYPSINAVLDSIDVKVNAEDYESALNLLAAMDKAE